MSEFYKFDDNIFGTVLIEPTVITGYVAKFQGYATNIEPHVVVGHAEIDDKRVPVIGVRAASEFVIPVEEGLDENLAAALGSAIVAWDADMAEHMDSPIHVKAPGRQALIASLLPQIGDCEFKVVWTSLHGSGR